MAYTYGSVTNCKVRNGQTRTEYECRLGYEVQSQSIENNTSTVKLRLEARSISSSYTTKGSSGLTSVIDGTTVKSNASVDMSNTNTWQNFGERTITITHNADGTYSASKSGSFTCTAGSSNYSLASGSASVTVKPATIPRASQPTVSSSSVAMGSSVTITTNRVSDSFTHTLIYSFGSTSGTIASSVGASTTWTPSLSLANQIPNNYEGTGTITCQTYNGSTLVGTKTVSLKLTVPSSVIPSISSIAISAGNSAVPSSWGVYVQGKSALKVVTTASGAYNSTIKSYKITGIDNNTYYSSNFTSSILQSSGTKTITVTVTDSRGRTATKTTTYTCVAYANPKITSASVTRCNEDGTVNQSGIYVRYTFKAEIAPINNQNAYTYKLGYKKRKDTYYTYIDIANESYTLNKTDVILTDLTFQSNTSYDFQFVVIDYFATTPYVAGIGTGYKIFNILKNGLGFAIGKMCEKEAFEVNMPTELYDTVDLNMGSGEAYYRAKRTDNGTEIGFGVDSGGVNHGLWSFLLNKWLVHADGFNVFLNGKDTKDYLQRYWSTDANTAVYNGVYGANPETANLPSDASNKYGILIVECTQTVWSADDQAAWIWQTFKNTSNEVWTRYAVNSDFSSWTKAVNNKGIKTLTAKGAVGWSNQTDGDAYLVTKAFMTFWNGAYDSSNSSNLTYCHQGTIQAKPVVAYSNASGTSGTVTLSVTSANYGHIRITYRNDDGQYGTISVSAIDKFGGFTTYGTIVRKNSTDGAILINSALFNVSGTTITIVTNSQASISFGGEAKTDTNTLYITKVEMWN